MMGIELSDQPLGSTIMTYDQPLSLYNQWLMINQSMNVRITYIHLPLFINMISYYS